MHRSNHGILRFLADRKANVAIPAAASLMIVVGTLALGVDYGALTLQKRKAQAMVDLMAIQGAGDVARAEERVRLYLADNDLNYAVVVDKGYLMSDGRILGEEEALVQTDTFLVVEAGSYQPDPALAVDQRFTPGVASADAVRVTARQKADLYFASMLTKPFDFEVSGTAAAEKKASFWIGSRLASLNGGVLNKVLGATLGTELSLSLMDYNALAAIDVDLLAFSDTLATSLSMQGATYDDLLASDVKLPQFLSALQATRGVGGGADKALLGIEKALGKANATIRFGSLVDLGAIGNQTIGSNQSLDVYGNLLQLVSSAAALSGGARQVEIDLATVVPGIGTTKVTLAIGEPPARSAMIAAGTVSDTVRTAQTRLLLETDIAGLMALLGTRIHLPLFVEAASGEARIRSITCDRNYGRGDVVLDVTPGLAEVAIGAVDSHRFDDFSRPLNVSKAMLVQSPVLSVSGIADVKIGNTSPQAVRFTASEISARTIKTASTRNFVGSLGASIARNLKLDIRTLGLSLNSPDAVASIVGQSLEAAGGPIDEALYNTLLALGIRVGQADVGVTDVDCNHPVLVQ